MLRADNLRLPPAAESAASLRPGGEERHVLGIHSENLLCTLSTGTSRFDAAIRTHECVGSVLSSPSSSASTAARPGRRLTASLSLPTSRR